VPHNRQFSDEQIKAILERGAVIGAALDAWMIGAGWVRSRQTTAEQVGLKLERIVDHIDHVCQIAGQRPSLRHRLRSRRWRIWREQTPADLDTIGDLARIPDQLAQRADTSPAEIESIAHGNLFDFCGKRGNRNRPDSRIAHQSQERSSRT